MLNVHACMCGERRTRHFVRMSRAILLLGTCWEAGATLVASAAARAPFRSEHVADGRQRCPASHSSAILWREDVAGASSRMPLIDLRT